MTPKQWMVSLSSLMFMLNKRVMASSPDLFPSVNTNQNCHRERRTPQYPEDYYDWWYCKLLRGRGPFQLQQKGSVSPNSAFSIQFQHETQMKRQSLSLESSRATAWPSSQQHPKEGLLETTQKLSGTVGSNDYFLLLQYYFLFLCFAVQWQCSLMQYRYVMNGYGRCLFYLLTFFIL